MQGSDVETTSKVTISRSSFCSETEAWGRKEARCSCQNLSGASPVTLSGERSLPAVRKSQFRSLGQGEDPWRREWLSTQCYSCLLDPADRQGTSI